MHEAKTTDISAHRGSNQSTAVKVVNNPLRLQRAQKGQRCLPSKTLAGARKAAEFRVFRLPNRQHLLAVCAWRLRRRWWWCEERGWRRGCSRRGVGVKDGGADREEFKNRGGGGGPAQPYFGTDGGRERC